MMLKLCITDKVTPDMGDIMVGAAGIDHQMKRPFKPGDHQIVKHPAILVQK